MCEDGGGGGSVLYKELMSRPKLLIIHMYMYTVDTHTYQISPLLRLQPDRLQLGSHCCGC